MNTIDVEQTGEGERVLPFYIVCDESASMAYNGGINAINKALPELHEFRTTETGNSFVM